MKSYRDQFHIPQVNGQDSIYLCGNSLGLQPMLAREYVLQEMDDWATLGVEGHIHARNPWLPYHEFLTEHMSQLVGAKPLEVVVMNSLTVNLHLLMVSFYQPKGTRRKIVIESDAFPSDQYAVASQVKFHGGDPETDILYWSPRQGEHTLHYEDLEAILHENKDEIALVFVGGVNYYTGQSFDLKRLADMSHSYGITCGVDLAHGAGNINYRLHDSGVDFAAWCSYKYLNSGPGSLSGVFVHERHSHAFDLPRFAGWWGHNKETRFGMRDPFDPLPGAEGWQLSNPPILPLAAMRASLELFHNAGIDNLRNRSIQLTDHFFNSVTSLGLEGLEVLTPPDSKDRGCQLSLFVRPNGREVFDFLTEHGVIADWREPDVIRVAPTPLYNTEQDIDKFVSLLNEAMVKSSK